MWVHKLLNLEGMYWLLKPARKLLTTLPNLACAPIRNALAQLPETVKVIAEPGRFIAAPAVISVSSVVGQAKREGKTWYYLDDGIYGSYSGVIFDEGNYSIECAL